MVRVEFPTLRYWLGDHLPPYLVRPISPFEREYAWSAWGDSPVPQDLRREQLEWDPVLTLDPRTGRGFTEKIAGRFADVDAYRDLLRELGEEVTGHDFTAKEIREALTKAHKLAVATRGYLNQGVSPLYPVMRSVRTLLSVEALRKVELLDWGMSEQDHRADCGRLWDAYQREVRDDDRRALLRQVHDAVAWRSFLHRAYARAWLLGPEAFLAEVLPGMLAGTMEPEWHAANACALSYVGARP
jgi:hypothetical protein